MKRFDLYHIVKVSLLSVSMLATSIDAGAATTGESATGALGTVLSSPFFTLLSNSSNATASSVASPPPTQSALAAVGQLLFNDPALSASGKQSCATCHSPSNAFTANNAAPVPFGGAGLNLQGLRNSPTTMYASYIPSFVLNAPTPPGAPAIASSFHPVGGIMRDGRQPSLASQAEQPFITSFEMGNSGSSQVVARLQSRPYLSQFTALFGSAILGNSDATLAAMGQAIAIFETVTPQFHPFSSKYDAYVNKQTALTAQELAGLQAFSDPARGHCSSCHSMTGGPSNGLAQFTDFSYHVIGVPRNWNIAFNIDNIGLPSYVPQNGVGLGSPNHNYYDMGLCGPLRTDLAKDTTLCGSFKVPTLRNVGVKETYDHNGVFTNLHDVVSFYATRNNNPSHCYLKANGSPDILYNDLPEIYAKNVEPVDHPGSPLAPNLSTADIQNIVSFLCTLTDGFDPKNPLAYNASGQCKGL